MTAVWLQLPQAGRRTSVDDVERWVRLAEDEGFDGVWVGDHLALPAVSRSVYPYQRGGFALDPTTPFLEAYSLLAFAAAMTERIRLATAVTVVPLRQPLLLAKVTATLDVISRGRLELGAGAGWHAEEMELFGVPFGDRGAITDEYLELVHQLWTGKPVTYRGRFTSVEEVLSLPSPVQLPGPPVWIGGHADPALRRVARWGGNWLAAGLSLDRVLAGRRRLEELLDGRCPVIGAQVAVHAGARPPEPLALSHRSGAGLDDLARAGLDVICLNVSALARAERIEAAVESLALIRSHLGEHADARLTT